jgi:hypothetical protein
MPGYELDGRQRRDLRLAISRGYNSVLLDQTLREYNLYDDDVTQDPIFNNRLNSLIDIFFQKGRLIELCEALAGERKDNEAVHAAILRVQQWLIEQERTYDVDAPAEALIPSPPRSDDRAAATPGAVIILGELNSTSAPEATLACDELAKELGNRNVPYERWSDGWLGTARSAATLTKRPIFVRTFLDPSKSNASEAAKGLSPALQLAFNLGDDSEKMRALTDCPRVLWRPQGPDWTPPAAGPLLYSSVDRPADFGDWLARLLNGTSSGGAVVYYEDPAAAGDLENTMRRAAVEECLVSAVTSDEPPLYPDSIAIGPDRFVKVVDSVGRGALTVIAAHDLGTLPDSREAAIARFKGIDERIRDALREKRLENAPLMCVGVLLRNAHEFEAEVEFSRRSTIRHWGMLKFNKGADGAYKPDMYDVGRLREHAVNLTRRWRERRAQ